MKKFAFLTAIASLAMVAGAITVSSTKKTIAEEAATPKTFTFVERLGAASVYSVDGANQTVQFKGGWDSKFLLADGVDVGDSKTTFSMHVQGSNGDGMDLQHGFGIYHSDDNYMMAYLRWSNAGTIDGIHLHGHINGQWAGAFSAALDQFNHEWGTAPEWYDSWSDFGGWVTDSDTPTGDDKTGNWNHFRAESAITLAAGFDMGLSIERVTFKNRAADRIQVFVKAVGTDTNEHTWYTPSIVTDAFTNPNGGADSPVKAQRPMIGLYNCNVETVTYSDFKQDGASLRVRDPNDTTGAVTFRSTCGVPEVRKINENRQTIDYKGAWDSAFLLADGLDTSNKDFSFSADVKGTPHDGNDIIIGYTLYHNADNYMKFYLRWSNAGTIDGLHMHGHVGGQWSGVFAMAKDQWEAAQTPDSEWVNCGEFADCWSDYSGWTTDSDMPAEGNFNIFRGNSAVFLDTGFTMGITVKRVTYKNRLADRVQLSVKAVGTDSKEHTWYTPSVCIDAFTAPRGGEASPLVEDAPKLAFTNNGVGTVTYSNMKFNGQLINAKSPAYHKVSFDVKDIEDQYIEDGLKATKPEDPVEEGALFDKWMNGEEEYDFNAPVTGDLNLTAAWLDDRALVTFDSNGGSAVEAQKIVKGEMATRPNDPTRQWHEFDGWYAEGEEEPFDFESTEVNDDIKLVAHWQEVEIKTEKNVLLNKFVPTRGTPAVLNAAEDGQSLNYQGGWDGAFITTDQFDTGKDKWEFGAHLSGDVGDGSDTMFGFVIYYDQDNYMLVYARWSNCGTIDGIHILIHKDGATSDHYQSARDYWGEDFATRGTFYDNWSDWGGWTTNGREPWGGDGEGNWNKYRSTSALLLNTGFDIKLYSERTKFAGRDVDRIQLGFTDLDQNGVQTTWYSAMICIDAFTNPFGGNDSAFKNVAPRIGFANNRVGTVNISEISFRETPTRTVTFDVDGETSTESVTNGFRVGKPADPSKEGYTFKGWTLDGEPYDFNTPVTGDITIVAEFEAIPVVSSSEEPTSSSEEPVSSETPASSETPVSSEVPASSETPVESSEQPASSEAPASSEDPIAPVAKGCGGTILGASLLASLVSLAGIVMIKSKKED